MNVEQKPQLKVTVISDYICPFCFIGSRRLESLRQDYDLKVNWCFVEIHPETPSEGMDVSQFQYSREHWQQLMQNLQTLAEEEGITLAEHTTTANSRKALLLAEASKQLGADKFYPLHRRLFEAFFVEGRNIGDEQVLRQLAAECQIPETILEQAWSDPAADGPADTVPEPLLPYLQYAGAIHATGVPTYIIGQQMLSGAISREKLHQAAKQALST